MNPPPLTAVAPTQDEEHLRLLSIFHYVVGGLTALFACIFLLHLGMGITMLVAPEQFTGGKGPPPPHFVGWMFTAMGGGLFLLGEALAACMILAGRALARRRRHTFVFVIACIECIQMPFGTVLGVFTILVLSRPTVKALFAAHHPPAVIAQ